MCYYVAHETHRHPQLRQNASAYIPLVKAGETIEVTDRGAPVALHTPLPDEPPKTKTHREQMIEDGRLVPGTQNWRDFKPLEPRPGEKPLSQILQEMRDEERY